VVKLRVVEQQLGRISRRLFPTGSDRVSPVWALAAAPLGVALGLYVTVVRHLDAPEAPFEIPWWVLAAMFFLAHVCVVHLHFRRDAHSFTLAEVPIVFGLFFASPNSLILARLVGAALALGFVRRQRPVKLAFNVSVAVLEASLAAVIFHSVASLDRPLDPTSHLAAFLATVGAAVITATLVFLAISVSERDARLHALPKFIGLGAVAAAANTSLALIGVVKLWRDAWLAWLLLVPAGVLFLAYRAYVSERKKHQSLEFLYETARLLHRSAELGSAMLALLAQARKVFRADLAEIVLFPSAGEAAVRTTLGPGDYVEVLQTVDRASVERGALSAVAHGQPVLVGRPKRDAGSPDRQVKDAMIAPLRGDQGVVGTLLVGNRLGDLNTFDREDFQLFETLANHAGLSLELIELDEQLKHQAFYDSLTDLPNWALFRDRVADALTHARDRGECVSVLVFDLDDFKTVNDSLGHAVGDQLLVAVSDRLRRVVSPATPARLGGDEFAVLAGNGGDPVELVRLAEQILDTLRSPFVLEGKEVSISASLGIASSSAEQDEGELLRNADLAMYKAKGQGRGNYAIFESSMHAAVLRRLELKAELQAATERGELCLHYQPIVELKSGRISGFEALVRWNHPARGQMPPSEFVALAEETGLIVPLGRWVLEEAFRRAATWQARFPSSTPLAIGVNISAAQLQRPGLVDDVARALREAQIEPQTVVLEITESIYLEDAELMIDRLHALKQLGVRLAIDDFGTGYSSLAYLARLPIDILKIAKPFVDGLGAHSEDAPLAEAIVRMGETLRLTTLAEGIEVAPQRDYLRDLGCRLGQGYFFAKPLDADAAEALLRMPQQGEESLGGSVVPLRRVSAAASS
jgi:diguanylate cyclase (GGDEF)-like protein